MCAAADAQVAPIAEGGMTTCQVIFDFFFCGFFWFACPIDCPGFMFFFVAGGVTFSWNTVNVYVTSLLCMQLILSWRVLHEAYRVHGALARARADRDEAGLR